MAIRSWIVYGYFCAALAEWSSSDRDLLADKAEDVYYVVFQRKSFPVPVLRQRNSS